MKTAFSLGAAVRKIEGGYILLARKILESPSWQGLNDAGKSVMITLLTLTNHKEKKWYNPVEKKEVVIKRGECVIGRKSLAVKSLVSERSVRTAINTLKTTKFLTIKTTSHFSLITICNYELYQNPKSYTDQVNDQVSDQAPTKHRPQLMNVMKENKEIHTDVTEFFDYFCLKTKKDLKLTSATRELIRSRLAEGFTLKQLKQAVDNFMQDDWADRHKFTDVVYCIGIRNKIDNLQKWLQPPKKQVKYA